MGGRNSGNRTSSNPMVARRAENVDPVANERRIKYLNEVRKLPDVDLSDPVAVEERVDLFFDMCAEHGMTPLVGNLAANFGMSRGYFINIMADRMPGTKLGITPVTRELLKKAYAFIDVNYEQALTEAKNPIPWIFYGKAALNWHEAPSETVITHKSESPRLQGGTTAEIEARYAEIVGVEEAPALPQPSEEDILLS